nr:IS1634 family transposase [Ectobacillus antri]
MNIQMNAIYQASYLNMISAIMKELKLSELIDQLVPVNSQCQTRPGDIVQLLLLDILSGRQALVHLEEWAGRIDLPKLLREGVQASHFNDDAIARHLDRLHDAGIHEIVSTFLLNTYKHENIPMRVFHGDTISKSLYVAYDSPSKVLNITKGYSRDRRGAKQIQFGLIGNEDGIPLYADVHDGNTSDKEWNPDVLKKLHGQFASVDLSSFIYVADSAAMTQRTLQEAKAANGYLITRGPNQLKIVKQALTDADQPDAPWSQPISFATSKQGAVYRLFETTADYYGHDVRLIVVESSALDRKKEKNLQQKREQERTFLEGAQASFSGTPFHCREDAELAIKQWTQETVSRFHTVSSIQVSEVSKRKRGRPKAGAQPELVTEYSVQLTITPDEEAFQRAKRKASRFVLVTTVPVELHGEIMDSQTILEQYKGQINVEMNFSFLKDPFYTDEIYLKKAERIRVMGYLFLLALAVYRVFQRRLRQHITAQRPNVDAADRASDLSIISVRAGGRVYPAGWVQASSICPAAHV